MEPGWAAALLAGQHTWILYMASWRPTSDDQAAAAAYRGLIDDLATAREENRATPPARSGDGAKRKPRAKKHVDFGFSEMKFVKLSEIRCIFSSQYYFES
jgi:hypothetical protein